MKGLTKSDHERYQRHLILPQVGISGQKKLKQASVLIVGAGGLGSPAALYLAAGGVGRIGLMDDDVVNLSNLQRQILYSEEQIGQSKTTAAAERLRGLNAETIIETHPIRFTTQTAQIVKEYDVVIDATDNFSTRYTLNKACVRAQKPMVYGAVHHFDGQVSVFAPHLGGACYQCVFPHQPDDEPEPVGVLSALPGIIGSLQAAEAMKLILGIGVPLLETLITYNALDHDWYSIHTPRNPSCVICGAHIS